MHHSSLYHHDVSDRQQLQTLPPFFEELIMKINILLTLQKKLYETR